MSYALNLSRLAVAGELAVTNAQALRDLEIFDADYPRAVQTLGAVTAGDGGDGIWRWDAASTQADNVGTVLQPTNHGGAGRWIRIYSGALNVRWFGAVGDGVADDQPALQATIDHSLWYAHHSVFIPAGTYRLARTLHVGYTFLRTALIYGEGPTYDRPDNNFGTLLVADFCNGPGINIQGARNAILRDFAIRGRNSDYVYTVLKAINNAPVMTHLNGDTWVDPAILAENPNADSRYAPYAGICIDGYQGPKPTPSYPDIAFPSFTGISTQYSGVHSDFVAIDNIMVDGFVVGVCLKPSGADGNGDHINMDNCFVKNCRYGISISHTQARQFVFKRGRIYGHHTALTNNVHGLQNGSPCFELYGASLQALINITNVGMALAGPFVMNGCYGESIYTIGYLGSSSATVMPATISDCDIYFNYQLKYGSPISLISGTYSNLQISNSTFRTMVGVSLFPRNTIATNLFLYHGSNFTTKNSIDGGSDLDLPKYYYYPMMSTGGAWLESNSPFPASGTLYSVSLSSTEHGVAFNYNSLLTLSSGVSRSTLLPLCSSIAVASSTDSHDEGVPVNLRHRALAISANSYTISNVGRNFTIELNSALADEGSYNLGGLMPGDLLYMPGKQAVFFIANRVGKVITAKLMNGFNSDNNPLFIVDTNSIIYSTITRFFNNSRPVYGTLTSGSPTITAVGRKDGYFDFEGEVGDMFFAPASSTQRIMSLDYNLTISGIDNVAKTITLSGNSSVSETRRLPLILKKPLT